MEEKNAVAPTASPSITSPRPVVCNDVSDVSECETFPSFSFGKNDVAALHFFLFFYLKHLNFKAHLESFLRHFCAFNPKTVDFSHVFIKLFHIFLRSLDT